MKPSDSSEVKLAIESGEELEQRFSSCTGMLRLIAERVLNGAEDVEEAMQRSYEAASSQRRRFRSEGEFRRWLVRTVLNEALMILHERASAAAGSNELILWQFC